MRGPRARRNRGSRAPATVTKSVIFIKTCTSSAPGGRMLSNKGVECSWFAAAGRARQMTEPRPTGSVISLIHKLPTTTTPVTTTPATATATATPTAAAPTAAAPADAAPTAATPTAAATARRRRRWRNPGLTAAAAAAPATSPTAASPTAASPTAATPTGAGAVEIRGVHRYRLHSRRDGDNASQQKIALHWLSLLWNPMKSPHFLINTFFVRLLQSRDFF
jgi:hypothetical protein